MLVRPYVPGVKENILLRNASNTTPQLKGLSMILDPEVEAVARIVLSGFPVTLMVPVILKPSLKVEPVGFVRTGVVREIVVVVPVEEIGNDGLNPFMLVLPALGVIVMLPPVTLQVAGTVPVAVIVPLVAA